MRYDIHYVTNDQLWAMEAAAAKAGYKKTEECYWTQIFDNGENTIVTIREDSADVLGDPVARFNAIVNPAAAQEEKPALEAAKARKKGPKARVNSDRSIKKAVNNWAEYKTVNFSNEDINIHISNGNIKLGAIMNVSLPPVVTCHNCAECKHYCYAVRNYNRLPDVSNAWNENYLLFLTDPQVYFASISYAVRLQRFFRWHVSGDIVNGAYFLGMIRVATENPNCEFLAFTKAYQIVNEAIAAGAVIPKNLHVLFSAAPGTDMPNPYRLPECHINFEDPSKNTYCGGAEYEHHCNGNCTECVINGCGCFFLKNGDVTIIDQH